MCTNGILDNKLIFIVWFSIWFDNILNYIHNIYIMKKKIFIVVLGCTVYADCNVHNSEIDIVT